MNLFLTSGCNERCAFCYAETYFQRPVEPNRPEALAKLLGHLRTWGALVRDADARGDMPRQWEPDHDEETRTLFSSRTVNLLGGEPTIHPQFEAIVREVAALGLGAIVFTNASMPGKIAAVREHLWTVVVNGHFADRAPALPLEPHRIHANLPIQPGHDVVAALEKVHAAGIRTVYLAFATPAGAKPGTYYTPEDLPAMQAAHRAASAFCRERGIFLAYDCSFPVCVDEAVLQTKCSSVPVMDPDGFVTICGGEYFHEGGKRHVSTFASLREVHAYTFRLIAGLRGWASRFDVCNACEHFNARCHGMCLAFRVAPSPVGRRLPVHAT